jgi:short-subunit dehydrogenase involved in D-alanine esterification of teichoic acids
MKIVIIGGSSGMGLIAAKLFRSLGHEIIISKEKLQTAVKMIGSAKSHVLDVTKEQEVIQITT